MLPSTVGANCFKGADISAKNLGVNDATNISLWCDKNSAEKADLQLDVHGEEFVYKETNLKDMKTINSSHLQDRKN